MTAIAGTLTGTPLALAGGVPLARPALAALIALPALDSPAAAEPLWQAEIHAGYGLAVAGSGAAMSARPTPLTVTALVAFAFNADPPLAGYGGLVVEALDRNAVGVSAGIKLSPHGSRLHLAGGGVVLLAPYTLLGIDVSGGACVHATPTVSLCGDLRLTAFLAGSDLGDGRTVTQGQLVAGLVFDAL
ncbi:MAG: hypothetical protein E6J90_32775 [Deltaproteobacteria bacterium]|nr:MAG: hypothetical protein E6J91_32485 [Deltaproteobacteria bacterium]TMQ12043.1 MAG: hypothetical protein E6J90_32775 [Deltaproteobacteria bacterium]